MQRGGGEKFVKADARFAVCAIGNGADNHKWLAKLVTRLRDGGGFHFHRLRVSKFAADGFNAECVVDKLIAAHNQALADIGSLKNPRGLLGGVHQSEIAGIAGRLLRHLPNGVAKRGYVHIMVRHLRTDDHIAHLQAFADAARAARVDDAVGRKMLNHQRGGDGGVYFADAALAQHDVFAMQRACVDGGGFAEAVRFQAA